MKSKLASKILTNNAMDVEVNNHSPPSKPTVKRTLNFDYPSNTTPKKVCTENRFYTPSKTNLFADYEEVKQLISFIFYQNFRFNKDYTILSVIGTGNFGKVYKCKNNFD